LILLALRHKLAIGGLGIKRTCLQLRNRKVLLGVAAKHALAEFAVGGL
jgi:hypothetical protein